MPRRRSFDLTGTEKTIAEYIRLGWQNQVIADHLGKSRRTIDCHVSNILSKLGYSNRAEIAVHMERLILMGLPK